MRALFRGSLLALTPRCWGFARQGTASVSLEAQARLHVMVTVTITVDRTESSAAPLPKAGSHPAAQPVSQTALSPQPPSRVRRWEVFLSDRVRSHFLCRAQAERRSPDVAPWTRRLSFTAL